MCTEVYNLLPFKTGYRLSHVMWSKNDQKTIIHKEYNMYKWVLGAASHTLGFKWEHLYMDLKAQKNVLFSESQITFL